MQKVKRRFSVCHHDDDTRITYERNLDDTHPELDRKTFAVTVIECNETGVDWHQRSIENRRRWKLQGCLLDLSLLLVVRDGWLFPHLLQMPPRLLNTMPDFAVKLSRNYSLSEVGGLFDELLVAMDHNMPSNPPLHENEFQVQGAKEHWPNWAIYVVVICVLLTALAFLLGNCITKRATPLRSKASGAVPKTRDRRMWGAGFSGGLWAAA